MFRVMSSPDDIQRFDHIRRRIDNALASAGRAPESCQLIVVSKTQSADRLAPLVQARQIELGENYLSEALPKIEALSDSQIWHYIGAIQSNKTAPIAQHFDWVHTVDRTKIATRLNDQRPESLAPLQVLIQVNIDEENSKAGCRPSEANGLARHIENLPRLRLRGLMSIPAAPHRALAALLETLKPHHPHANCLSMGMSGDLEPAIAAGATQVRIGTAIFGPRPKP